MLILFYWTKSKWKICSLKLMDRRFLTKFSVASKLLERRKKLCQRIQVCSIEGKRSLQHIYTKLRENRINRRESGTQRAQCDCERFSVQIDISIVWILVSNGGLKSPKHYYSGGNGVGFYFGNSPHFLCARFCSFCCGEKLSACFKIGLARTSVVYILLIYWKE